MTTGAPAPARIPTPRPKAGPASNLSPESAAALNSQTAPPYQVSGASAPSRSAPRRGARSAVPSSGPLSDRATAFLIRRVICPQQLDKGRNTPTPIEDLLPPLTSRNDVDLQLYALIAIILREFVQNWYSKITPDEIFVAEIVQLIAHCTRALEQRLRKVDLESLLFDEIPDLVDKHVNARRAAQNSVVQPPLHTNPREVYHSLCPLRALSPIPRPESPDTIGEQAQNEAAYRQLLVHGVLAILLPTEDLENNCLVALVGQLFSELIIGDILANRLSEPWLIWEGLIILSRVVRERTNAAPGRPPTQPKGDVAGPNGRRPFSLQGLFWSVMQWCFVATSFVRLLIITLVSSRSLPPRTRQKTSQLKNMTGQKSETESTNPTTSSILETRSGPVKVPVLAFRVFPAAANLIEMNVRMPWLSSAFSLAHWMAMTGPGRIADVDGTLDRILSHSLIHARLLDPGNLPPLLRGVRAALFPNNAPGKSSLRAPTSDAELASLRRRCATALWGLVPKQLGRLYFGVGGGGGDGGGGGGSSTRGASGSWWRSSSRPNETDEEEQSGSPGSSAASRARSGPTDSQRATSANLNSNTRSGDDPGLADSGRSAGASASGPLASRDPPAPSSDAQGLTVKDQADEDEDEQRILGEIESGIVDMFGDAYCNKHLVYGILELVLVRLMPELAEKGVIELWEERLN